MYKSMQVAIMTLAALLLISGCTTTSSQSPRSDRVEKNLLTERHAQIRAQQVKSVDYKLSLTLNKESERFSGEMAIDFILADNNTRPLTIDLEEGQIELLQVNGKRLDPDYIRYFITVPAEHLVPGKNNIVIRYSRPYATNGTGFHRRVDADTGDIYLYSDFQTYNANRMFPAFDQPDLKATFTLDVEAPKDWQLISTTREYKTEDKGVQKHWYFKPSQKITTYVFSLHAGPYHMWQDDSGKYPLRLFARKEVAEHIDPKFWFDATHKSMAFLEDYFAIEYPYEKYDQIIVPDYNAGAMENVAAVTFNEDSFVVEEGMTKEELDDLADTIAHEAAHMWFGNLVTMQWWNGLWLNESFASYMAILTMDKGMGISDAWTTFNSNFKSWGYRADQRVTTHPIELPVADTDVADGIFDGITYGKGAAVVAQLSHYLGADAFKAGIRNYMKKYAGGNTTLENFMTELSKASGKDLTRWTQDWLFAAGVNTIYSDIQCANDKVTSATIYQNPDNSAGILREHKIRVGFFNLANSKVELAQKYELVLEDKATAIKQAIGQKCPGFVYANTDDLGYVKVDLKGQSLDFLEKHISKIADEQLRVMLWQDLWHKARGATMPIEQYLELAKTQFDIEQSDSVKGIINGSIYSAFGYLGRIPGQKAEKLRLDIEQFTWQQLNQSHQDLEQTKEAFNMFTGVAHSKWGLAKVRAILLGQYQVKDMPLTPSIRWDLVKTLNRYGFENYAELTEREFKQDPDEVERNQAIIVRPDVDTKSPWLDNFINNPKADKLSITRSLMSWAFPSDQSDLFDAQQQRFIDGLEKVSTSAPMIYQKNYARRLIKGACTAASVARLQQAIEQYRHLSPALHDIIRVAHQADEQCYQISQYNQ